ncbi:hypothetical protein EVAR_101625_1 [Eumeta japonica]|uniref:Uncharacterized protein n=1 Tax=Eumeta variegata TaxID=151549 RepID=A0A4C1TGM9_EUMVA|nr:hypothetical protein EVAR_101625_1 [Eumeta japonica]
MNQGNTPQDMNPEMAKALFCHGAVCLLLAFLREQNSEQELIVREWDVNSEELREDKLRNRNLRKTFKRQFGYVGLFFGPDFHYSEWRKLDTVTKECVERCIPALGTIRTCVELLSAQMKKGQEALCHRLSQL